MGAPHAPTVPSSKTDARRMAVFTGRPRSVSAVAPRHRRACWSGGKKPGWARRTGVGACGPHDRLASGRHNGARQTRQAAVLLGERSMRGGRHPAARWRRPGDRGRSSRRSPSLTRISGPGPGRCRDNGPFALASVLGRATSPGGSPARRTRDDLQARRGHERRHLGPDPVGPQGPGCDAQALAAPRGASVKGRRSRATMPPARRWSRSVPPPDLADGGVLSGEILTDPAVMRALGRDKGFRIATVAGIAFGGVRSKASASEAR
jgi:hypothetical protein